MIIDLRSDTVTKPTPAMLEAMMNAEVGDDVYKEDPTVNELERRVADFFEMDEALFFPTGSMSNQAAIKLHTLPGEQLICDKYAHVYHYEGGGVSFNSGVSCKLVEGHRGKITAELVKDGINAPDFYHSPRTSLVCLENTTNKGGGACYDFETIAAIKSVTDDHGLGLHLDGARIWNSLVATGQDAKDYGKYFDTISACFSKGMGTPMGTVLAGKKAVMKDVMRIRKVLGGGMRQVGYVAAAALYALDNHIDRLAEDHQRASELASVLDKLDYIQEVEPVETNIVIFYLDQKVDAESFGSYLAQNNFRVSEMGEGKWRMVTHLDYTQKMHTAAQQILKAFKA